MTKSNPLFVDSTVLHGDRIGTHVELNRVQLHDEETVSVLITNHLGETQQATLNLDAEDGSFTTRLWLSHQKAIVYCFVIEKAGEVLFASRLTEDRAQYALIADWEPYFEEQTLPKPSIEKAKRSPALSLVPELSPSTREFSSIMEKWGF